MGKTGRSRLFSLTQAQVFDSRYFKHGFEGAWRVIQSEAVIMIRMTKMLETSLRKIKRVTFDSRLGGWVQRDTRAEAYV